MAVLSALWAFDGWNNLPMAAGEVENPARTIPMSLLLGVLAVFGIYALANLAYFYALPLPEILSANSKVNPTAPPVAALAAMMVSALGAMNGSILTSSRLPYAMARDGIFPEVFGRLSGRSQVPVISVLLQGLWACVLALSGTFDQLTDWVVFASWIFYALCGFSLLLFRRRRGVTGLHYSVPFYPLLPLLFCFLAVLLLINTLMSSPRESAFGLAFILTGVPVYFLRRNWLQLKRL
jgi:APA family basic amino acid/polyamine antiporter